MKISKIIAKLEWAKEVMGDIEVEFDRGDGGPWEEISDVLFQYSGSQWDDTRDVVIPAAIIMKIY